MLCKTIIIAGYVSESGLDLLYLQRQLNAASSHEQELCDCSFASWFCIAQKYNGICWTTTLAKASTWTCRNSDNLNSDIEIRIAEIWQFRPLE